MLLVTFVNNSGAARTRGVVKEDSRRILKRDLSPLSKNGVLACRSTVIKMDLRFHTCGRKGLHYPGVIRDARPIETNSTGILGGDRKRARSGIKNGAQ